MVKRAIVRLLKQGGVSRYFRLPRKLDLPRELFDWLWWEIRVEWNPDNPLHSEIRLVPVSKSDKRRYVIIDLEEEEPHKEN